MENQTANVNSEQKIQHISVDKAAEMLGKSPHCVRQLLTRKKLKRCCILGNIMLEINDVLTYQARKKGLPSWEENVQKIQHKNFITAERAAQELVVQPSYIVRLVKSAKLEGYVTADGALMISGESINNFLRAISAEDEL